MNDHEIVANYQRLLNNVFGENLQVDGIYGKKTMEAIKRMQHKLGLTADGLWGVNTQKAVENLGVNGHSGINTVAFPGMRTSDAGIAADARAVGAMSNAYLPNQNSAAVALKTPTSWSPGILGSEETAGGLTPEEVDSIYATYRKNPVVFKAAGQPIYETPVKVRDTAPSSIKKAYARDAKRKEERLKAAIRRRGY